jgi:hypothetical protein
MSTHSAECSPHTCLGIETLRRAPSMNAACGWTLIRKTSLLRKINPMMRRSSFTKKDIYKLNHLAMIERRNVLEIMIGIPANCFAGSKLGSISSLRCQKSRTRILKDTTCEVMFRGRYQRGNVVDLKSTIWWSQTGSNRRPHACKARALPAELWPRTRRRMLHVDY